MREETNKAASWKLQPVAGCSLLTLTNGRNSASRGTPEEDEYTTAEEREVQLLRVKLH